MTSTELRGDLSSQTWMYARDARQQQAGVAANQAPPYPSTFRNYEDLPLSTPGSIQRRNNMTEWLQYPLIPGKQETWTSRSDVSLGGVRSIYTEGNPNHFDVGYHDSTAGTSTKGYGEFALAQYHEAVQPPPLRRSFRLAQQRAAKVVVENANLHPSNAVLVTRTTNSDLEAEIETTKVTENANLYPLSNAPIARVIKTDHEAYRTFLR